jgi:hypothetical protein
MQGRGGCSCWNSVRSKLQMCIGSGSMHTLYKKEKCGREVCCWWWWMHDIQHHFLSRYNNLMCNHLFQGIVSPHNGGSYMELLDLFNEMMSFHFSLVWCLNGAHFLAHMLYFKHKIKKFKNRPILSDKIKCHIPRDLTISCQLVQVST